MHASHVWSYKRYIRLKAPFDESAKVTTAAANMMQSLTINRPAPER